MKKFLFIILTILLIAASTYTQVKQQWVRTSSTSVNGFRDIHLDAYGNVYLLGCSSDSNNSATVQLASYSSSGEQRFLIFNNPGMVVSGWFFDAYENIYTAGYYPSYPGSGISYLFKYNSSGMLQWALSDSAYDTGILKGLAGDASGSSYLLKYYWGKNTIIKFNSNGTFIRRVSINEIFNPGTITADPAGNIMVAGIQYSGQYSKCLAMKYSPRGIRQWFSEYNPGRTNFNVNNLKIKFYNNNTYLMTSASDSRGGSDYLLIKYTEDGLVQSALQFNKNDNDEPSDFIVDSKSNAIITGNNGTVKFNKKGLVSWIDTTVNIKSAALDKQNNIYLTGKYCFTMGSTYTDMISLRLSPEGKKMWSLFYKESDPGSYEEGQLIAVDTMFNVYACGKKIYSSNVTGAVLKYTQQYIDTSNLRFMPLTIGNVWVYKVTGNNYSNYVRTAITKDTLIDGRRYFYCQNFPLSGYSNWLRTDTITGNLYAYMPEYSCSYSLYERKIDSLSSGKSDTSRVCTSETEFETCIDTGSASLGVKTTLFKQFQGNTQNVLTRCYAKDFGIYNIVSNNASPSIHTLRGCVVNGHLYGDTMMRFSVSGTIKFRDNKQPVTNGKVKALKYIYSTGKIAAIDSAIISSSGVFRLENITLDSCDIMAYQDDELEDFPPGFHDSTIYWQSSATLVSGTNLNNINVYVERIIKQTGSYHLNGHVYALNSGSNSPPLENTRVYVLSDNVYRSFDITNLYGGYAIDSIPPGEYTFIVDRLGFIPAVRQVTLSDFSKDTVDFYLLKYSGIDKDYSTIPVKYSLIQNYPNPFNPSTTFVFDIPLTSDVSITIYDITGREISKVIESRLNAGRYKITWDASELASGVYFYRLEAKSNRDETGFTETKKLVLMK